MAFLDNSGDIILDAVLTDTGRMRLAKGDGTFKIVKFALSDDEIVYSTDKLTLFVNDGAQRLEKLNHGTEADPISRQYHRPDHHHQSHLGRRHFSCEF